LPVPGSPVYEGFKLLLLVTILIRVGNYYELRIGLALLIAV
jgi:hypothetical protein